VLRSRKGLARTAINKRVGRIRAIFKWGVGEELLPASAYHGLLAVRALPPNAPGVRSAPKRQPAFWGDIEKIAPHLPPPVAAMLRLQFLTGMRSGETRIIRPIDIDMSDPECWRYRPGSDAGPHGKHKNAWRGQDRVVPLGPQCQELLRPWLAAVPSQTDYLFSPRRWMDQHIAQRRADRKTPMTPSQRKRRRKSQPRKTASGCYLAASYTQTVRKACLKAGVMFTPYCLRHGRKMEVEKAAGSDAARCLLGQKSIEATMHYGQLDVARATELMKKLG
jgi:integrase